MATTSIGCPYCGAPMVESSGVLNCDKHGAMMAAPPAAPAPEVIAEPEAAEEVLETPTPVEPEVAEEAPVEHGPVKQGRGWVCACGWPGEGETVRKTEVEQHIAQAKFGPA